MEQDFDTLHPGKSNSLYEKWDCISENLITYACKVRPTWHKDLNMKQDMEKLTKGEWLSQSCAWKL